LKSVREKCQITYKCKPITVIPDFPTETLKARREWNEAFQAMKENTCKPSILYVACSVMSALYGLFVQ
jgi:hypothetical protein